MIHVLRQIITWEYVQLEEGDVEDVEVLSVRSLWVELAVGLELGLGYVELDKYFEN